MIMWKFIIFISVFGILGFYQIKTGHEINKLIIKQCFEEYGDDANVTITKKSIFSPVICESGNGRGKKF